MFGSHLSISGGMHNALIEAESLGMDCVQVFTKNQRQWKTKPLTDEQVTLWKDYQQTTGIGHAVSHAVTLIPTPATSPANIAGPRTRRAPNPKPNVASTGP